MKDLLITSLSFMLITAGCAAPASQTAPSPPTRSEITEIGDFLYSHTRDPFTDEPAPMFSTFDERENGMLSWDCQREGLSVRAGLSGDVAEADDVVMVRARFDQQEPSEAGAWLIHRQGQFTFAYMNPADNVAFSRAALYSGRVRLEITDPDTGARQTYDFSLNGFQEGFYLLPCLPTS